MNLRGRHGSFLFLISLAASLVPWSAYSNKRETPRPCECVGYTTKSYQYDEEQQARQKKGETINFQAEAAKRTNWNFYCTYTCADRKGSYQTIERAISLRSTRPGGKLPEPQMRCGGLYYGFHTNPNDLGHPMPQAPEREAKPYNEKGDDAILGFIGIGRDEFPQAVYDWAKQVGCAK